MNHYQILNLIDNNPCLKLKLMGMGLIPGQNIDVEKSKFGLYLVHLKSLNGHHEQTYALREDEFEHLCVIPL